MQRKGFACYSSGNAVKAWLRPTSSAVGLLASPKSFSLTIKSRASPASTHCTLIALLPLVTPPSPLSLPYQAARRGRRLPPAVERLALGGSALLVALWAAALVVGDVVALADTAAGRLGVSGGVDRVLGNRPGGTCWQRGVWRGGGEQVAALWLGGMQRFAGKRGLRVGHGENLVTCNAWCEGTCTAQRQERRHVHCVQYQRMRLRS